MATSEGAFPQSTIRRRQDWLKRGAVFCYASVAAGQLLFLHFILTFYFTRTLAGDFAAWNDKPLLKGFVAGDMAGNLVFAAHVLFAGVITLGGLLQLVPLIRQRWPAVHRWTGRLFLLSALTLALGGLWLVWIRGTWIGIPSALGVSLDALLILVFAILALRAAMGRRLADHRRWAIRLFAVAGAVWFMRVGYAAWEMATGGLGVGKRLDGPFDIFLAFSASLLPLAIAEIYLRADRYGTSAARNAAAALLFISGAIVLAGSTGAWILD